MRHRFRARPRLAAAAVLSLAGGLLAAAPPAHGACPRASVWIYENQEGPTYVWGPEECVHDDPTWHDKAHKETSKETDTTSVPPGTPTGAGVEVWVAIPPN